MADGVLSGIVSILGSMPIHTFWKVSITTLNPELIGWLHQAIGSNLSVAGIAEPAMEYLRNSSPAVSSSFLRYSHSSKASLFFIFFLRGQVCVISFPNVPAINQYDLNPGLELVNPGIIDELPDPDLYHLRPTLHCIWPRCAPHRLGRPFGRPAGSTVDAEPLGWF